MIRIPSPSSLRLVSRGCSHSVPLPRDHSYPTTAQTISILSRISIPIPPPCHSWPRHQFSLLRRNFCTNHSPPPESFAVYTAASFSPKGKNYDPDSEIYRHASGSREFVPGPEELRSRAGQDAYFITGLEKVEGAVAVGVVCFLRVWHL